MNETHLVWLFAVGFPLFFAALWLSVMRILSWFGWSKFVTAFGSDRPVPADARRFSMATMVIGRFPGGVSYKNAMTVWLNRGGVWLRPAIFFRMFHPLLHFGWDAVADIEPRKQLWIQAYHLTFRRDLPPMIFAGGAGQALFDQWHSYGGGRPA